MTTKQIVAIGAIVVLAGICLYINRDWFASESIQIYHRSDARGGFFRRGNPRRDTSPSIPIFFGFNRKITLKSVKVIPVSDIETNKYPHPIWHMISDSNSIALKGFSYGMYIQGMRPAVKNALPDPLQPGVPYRLLLDTGSAKGEHDFVPLPKTQ